MPIATPQGTLDFKSVDKVTFVGASSNTVIDTTTGSLGVGVGVGGPTSNLHVVGNTRLEGDINMLHTANTASIKLNSNVVTEFPRSKKLIKYPRVALTSDAETGSGYQGYFVSSSSDYNADYTSYKAFNAKYGYSTSVDIWYCLDYPNPEVYSGTDYAFNPSHGGTATPDLFTGAVQGEWLKIQLPDKIALDHYILTGSSGENEFPRDWTVYGSVNGTNWDLIDSRVSQIFGDGTGGGGTATGKIKTFQLDTLTNEYFYFAFVFTRGSVNRTQYIGVGEIELYGVPEYDPEAHGTDVVVKSEANVPNTDWLKVYYDAKDLTNISSPISDLSGNSVNGAVNGNINVSDRAFVFDGVGDTITGTVPGVSGDYAHTVTMWIKFDDIHADDSGDTFFEMGTRSGNNMIGLYAHPNKFHYYFFNNDHHYNYTVTNGVWYHVTATYSGGDSVKGRKLYINGTAIRRTATGSGGTYTLANGNFTLGGLMTGHSFGDTYSFKGSIANFRFFDRALSSDEIGQLYTYQKEEFGHSTNSLTLKGGRLGIGTSEPRAMLDVRGDMYGPGIIQVQSTTFDGITSGSSISFTTLSGLTTSITPKRTGSKILVLLNLFWSGTDDAYFQGNVKKDGTVLVKQEGSVGSASKTSFGMLNYDRPQYFLGNIGFSYLDDTNIGTEAIEYTVEVRNRAISAPGYTNWYINYTSSTSDANRLTAVSTLTLIEIQQ